MEQYLVIKGDSVRRSYEIKKTPELHAQIRKGLVKIIRYHAGDYQFLRAWYLCDGNKDTPMYDWVNLLTEN